MGQGGSSHGDSGCRDAPNTEPLTRCDDTHAWHSRDATAMCHSAKLAQRYLPAGQKKATEGLSNKEVLQRRVEIFRKLIFF